jgi:Zn-dependent metalloprotease
MIKSLNFFIFLFFIFFGLYQTTSSQESNVESILAELRTKYVVDILRTNGAKIPTYIEGDLTPADAQGDEVNISYFFFEQNQQLFRMEAPRKELVVRKIKDDNLGMRHIFFKQAYQGIEVYGGELIVHFSPTNRIKVVNGIYKHGIKISPDPSIQNQRAEEIALSDLEINFGIGDVTDTRLMIYDHKGTYHLIWKIMLKIKQPLGNWEYFVDAFSGDILYKANRIKF